jgi:hypothetical protein
MNPDITCAACGRSYVWKAQLAGKRLRCKCGAALAVPENAAAEDSELEPPAFDGLDLPSETAAIAASAAPPVHKLKPRAAAAGGKRARSPLPGNFPDVAPWQKVLGVVATLLFGAMFAGLGVWQMGDPGPPMDTGRARRGANALLSALHTVGGNKLIAWLCFGIAGASALFAVYLVVTYVWEGWRERS